MNDRNPLLKQILLDDDLAGFRQESLEAGLVALRRERHRRKVVRGSATALLAATAIFAVLFLGRPPRAKSLPIASSPRPRDVSPRPSQVRFITDDELLALFPNRSTALIGVPGEQQLVFLDESTDGQP